MNPQTFIFIGPSGCGKGTQAELLTKAIREKNPSANVLTLETGKKFRKLIEEKGYTNDLVREIIEKGALQPEFLAVWNITEQLVQNLKAEDHLVIDGIPRTIFQADMLDSMLTFYKRENPTLININVSSEWATERLKARGRGDDANESAVKSRLAWYENQVVPAIKHLRANPKYKVLEINGEQSIEKVHADILAGLGM